MNFLRALKHELRFSLRDRSLWLWMALLISLSSLAVGYGLAEVKRQNATIQKLIVAAEQDRVAESENFKDWGYAAYYNFHLTYNPPSPFAFAAMGQRDAQAWKHRIRMLALEGQIYERDVGNPSTALIGRFDFAFLAAFIFPLVLIMLLYDLRASERAAGRFNLLEATVGRPRFVWASRTCVRAVAAFLCLIVPMIIAGWVAGTSFTTLVLALFFLFLFALFWGVTCYFMSGLRQSGSFILMALVAVWLFTAVVLPAGSRLAIDRLVPLPSGAEILLLQRETVNDAWDLPREATMSVFFERHPEWLSYTPAEGGFEWPWYYAFQQVGDQKTEPLARAYLEGRLQRDHIAAWVSLLAPPSLLERALQSLAKTDLKASIAYEQKIRAFHADLRAFYYPKFFEHKPFDKGFLEDLPEFEPEL